MPQALPPPLFDPFAPGFTDDPYPQYAALRAAAPVYQDPLGFWLLTCYDDVSWLLRAGLSVEDRNVAANLLLERREQVYGEEAARPRVAMLYRDPPDHTRLRRLVSKASRRGRCRRWRRGLPAWSTACSTRRSKRAGRTWSTPWPSRCRSP